MESFNGKLRDELLNVEASTRCGGEGVGREMAQGVQPATASQRLGLSAAGAGGQITQVQAQSSIPWSGLQMVPGLT